MRSVWNGSIIFGLVSIPIKLYSGSEEQRLDLNMLDRRDSARIRYKRVNENTGKEVEWEDIIKGFATEQGYILLEKEDFEFSSLLQCCLEANTDIPALFMLRTAITFSTMMVRSDENEEALDVPFLRMNSV